MLSHDLAKHYAGVSCEENKIDQDTQTNQCLALQEVLHLKGTYQAVINIKH